jgi:hypothetical protein
MAPLTIAILWLLCLSHADMVDGCRHHLLLLSNPTTPHQDVTKDCSLIRRGIMRCMSGITESISLPGLLLWLPHMLNTSTSTSINSSSHDSTTTTVHQDQQQPFQILLHQCGSTLGSSFSSILYTLMGSATHFISTLALGSAEGSHQARETMRMSLRNLSLTPIVLIQNLSPGLRYFSNALTHERVRRKDQTHIAPTTGEAQVAGAGGTTGAVSSLLSDVEVFQKVFSVWLELEIGNEEQMRIEKLLGRSFVPWNGFFHRNIELTEIIFMKEFFIRSLSFLQQVSESLRKDDKEGTGASGGARGGGLGRAGGGTGRGGISCQSAILSLLSTTCLNICLAWWSCVNNLGLNLLSHPIEDSTTHSSSNLSLLSDLLSPALVTPMMTLFLALKDASLSITCQLTRSSDNLPPNSSFIDSSNQESDQPTTPAVSNLIIVTEGDVFGVWLSFLTDLVIKVTFITQQISSQITPPPASAASALIATPAAASSVDLRALNSQFVFNILTHLSSLSLEKMVTNDHFLPSKEEKHLRIVRSCQILSSLTLVTRLSSNGSSNRNRSASSVVTEEGEEVKTAIQQFVLEWNQRNHKSSEFRCREIVMKKKDKQGLLFHLLGEDIFPFPELLQEIHCLHSTEGSRSPNRNLFQDMEESKDTSSRSTPPPCPPPPHLGAHGNASSPVTTSRSFLHRGSSHLLTCSPYSPVIALRRGAGGGGTNWTSTLKSTPPLLSASPSTPTATPSQQRLFDQIIDLCTTVSGSVGQRKRSYDDTTTDVEAAAADAVVDPSLVRLIDQTTSADASPQVSPVTKRSRTCLSAEESLSESSSPDPESPKDVCCDSSQKNESDVIPLNQSLLSLNRHRSVEPSHSSYSAGTVRRAVDTPPVEGTLVSVTQLADDVNSSHLLLSRTLTSGCYERTATSAPASVADPVVSAAGNGAGGEDSRDQETTQTTLSGRTLRFDQSISGRGEQDFGSMTLHHSQHQHPPLDPPPHSLKHQQWKQPSEERGRGGTLETVVTYLDHAQDAIYFASQNLSMNHSHCSGSRPRGLLQDSSTEHQLTPEDESSISLWSSQLDATLIKCHELMGQLLSLRRSFPAPSSTFIPPPPAPASAPPSSRQHPPN